MLRVKTVLQPSPIHRFGLFADKHISKGTTVWQLDPGVDMTISMDHYKKLSSVAQKFFDHFGYFSQEMQQWICAGDNHRFVNHSPSPNMGTVDNTPGSEGRDIALRDIEKGEELTFDYRSFGEDPEST